MTKKEKVNWIKWWLQRYGERNNETFYTEIVLDEITWGVLLQYNYSSDGIEYDPASCFIRGAKHRFITSISYSTVEELDKIITVLNQRIEQ